MSSNQLRHIICVALMMSTSVLATMAQEQQTQPLMPGETPKPTKYVAVEEQKEHLVFFQGFTLSVDGYGPVAMMVSDYGTLEGALRLNLKNTFFPIIDMSEFTKVNETEIMTDEKSGLEFSYAEYDRKYSL